MGKDKKGKQLKCLIKHIKSLENNFDFEKTKIVMYETLICILVVIILVTAYFEYEYEYLPKFYPELGIPTPINKKSLKRGLNYRGNTVRLVLSILNFLISKSLG